MKGEQFGSATFYRPQRMDELDDLATNFRGKLTYVAGATDLMVQEAHWKSAQALVDLTAVPEISETLEQRNGGILIGAALPMSQLIGHPLIREKFPILVEACRQIGSVQIQNRATLGGNIANASPAGDSLPPLNVLDAELWIGPRQKGEYQKLKIDQVMLGPGQTSLQDNRYIAYIYLPFPAEENPFWYFRKVGQRHALAISKLSLAVLGWKKGRKIEEIRICAGSVAPQVKRAEKTEQLLNGSELNEEIIEKARRLLMNEINPITDIRSTRSYRREISGELLREALYRFLQK